MVLNPDSSLIESTPEKRVKRRAIELGFDLAGIAPVAPSQDRDYLMAWLEAGHHADMAYMQRNIECRLDPTTHLPDAISVVMVAVSCNVVLPEPEPGIGRFARYALNDDYHDWIGVRLRQLASELPNIVGLPCRARPFCDTSAVLERELARRAGLGWIGKNAMLINRRCGSHILLGGMFVDIQLVPDAETTAHCGSCRRCLEACPTRAIVAPRVVEARLCIAYHTIESRSSIPERIAAGMGSRVFGCDICQEVCPFNNRKTPQTRHDAFRPRAAVCDRPLAELASLTDDDFRHQFSKSAVKRAKARGLRRNALAALKANEEGSQEPSSSSDD